MKCWRPVLGTAIEVAIKVPADAPPLLADKAQLETVLVNLAVNARDAMPDGGRFAMTVTTERVGGIRHPAALRPGGYLRLDLMDTGAGMDEATLAHAAEPFFTTKPAGQGTGLGLAMARGFAQQSGGSFAVKSVVGVGTTVTLWFPEADGDAGERRQAPGRRPCIALRRRTYWSPMTTRWCAKSWLVSWSPEEST